MLKFLIAFLVPVIVHFIFIIHSLMVNARIWWLFSGTRVVLTIAEKGEFSRLNAKGVLLCERVLMEVVQGFEDQEQMVAHSMTGQLVWIEDGETSQSSLPTPDT